MKYIIFILVTCFTFSADVQPWDPAPMPEVNETIDTSSVLADDAFMKSMSIKDFASLVSKNDHINIMIGDDVNASTSIFMSTREKNYLNLFVLRFPILVIGLR